MRYLFVHQSFPGQYLHLVRALSLDPTNQIVGLGINPCIESLPATVNYIRYDLTRGNFPGINPLLLDFDSKLIRAEACADAAILLRDEGFYPDVICAHPGWGEALFLKDIWPESPILSYQEYFYNPYGYDFDFDPEFSINSDWRSIASLRVKNVNPLLMLHQSTWNVTPTQFQLSTFPSQYHRSFSVIHDGIDSSLCCPGPRKSLRLSCGTIISESDQIVTFVNRTFEPYRGCHTFIRSIPLILEANPNAHIFLIGSISGVSYGSANSGSDWIQRFLEEISDKYDPSKIHFTNALPYSHYVELLRQSSCHVYLTYPFVLSWSLLEAMSIGLPIVGSDTAPVQEVIRAGDTGLLVNFFSPSAVAGAVTTLLSDRGLATRFGDNARRFVLTHFSFQRCIPRQISLINLVASRKLG